MSCVRPMTEFHPSFATFYAEGPYRAHIREQRDLGALGASLTLFEQPAGEYPDPPTPDFVLGAPLAAAARARINFGAGRFDYRLLPNTLWLQPSFAASDITVSGRHRCLFLTLPDASVRSLVSEDIAASFGDFGRLHAQGFVDELAAAILNRLWAESEGQSASLLFIEDALGLLVRTLWRTSCDQPKERPPTGCLTPRQASKVTEYIEAHLDGDPLLADMAGLLGLTPNHFSTAFRRTLGEPPHRYLTLRRIERAKSLLLDDDLTVTDIALATGFSSSAHFATAFRRHVGTSPTDWRRARV